MADPQIGGTLIPDDQKDRGVYTYRPLATSVRNGELVMAQGKFASATWVFNVMNVDQWDWWITTLLGGARSKAFTGNTVLWDDTLDPNNMPTFTYCVMDRPIAGAYENGLYKGVAVNIHGLREP